MKQTRAVSVGTLVLACFAMSCGAARSDVIFKPVSFRSPQLDFTKVQAMAIMPINATTDEVPGLTSLINDGLPGELKRTQSAWKIFGHDDVLRQLNEKNLGRGYQNYLADLNTYAAVAGTTPNFTAETKSFFADLKKEMKFETILFTSYGFKEETVVKKNVILSYPVTEKVLTVTVILYEVASQRTWWISTLSVRGGSRVSNPELAAQVLRGIAGSFGKGDLRQL